ncbi:copper-binding protein [Oleiharenicola lentus]|uniref:copper-binding protein n=1 Tax=Oleiharenicola lentus TaxID=2508720 RepID=UPI003F681B49
MKLLSKFTTLLASVIFAIASLAAVASEPKSADSKNCGCKCCVGKEVCCCHTEDEPASTPPAAAPIEKEKTAGHALKGVIVEIMAEQKGLLVKHEEIPGVMKAMTMLLRVDEAALKSATKNAAVTGSLVRRGAVWWLDDVKFAVK